MEWCKRRRRTLIPYKNKLGGKMASKNTIEEEKKIPSYK
jgi:hypothetical protein